MEQAGFSTKEAQGFLLELLDNSYQGRPEAFAARFHEIYPSLDPYTPFVTAIIKFYHIWQEDTRDTEPKLSTAFASELTTLLAARFPYATVRIYRRSGQNVVVVFPLQSVQKSSSHRKAVMKANLQMLLSRLVREYSLGFSCFCSTPTALFRFPSLLEDMEQVINSVAMPQNSVLCAGEIALQSGEDSIIDLARWLPMLLNGNREQLRKEVTELVRQTLRDSVSTTRSYQLSVDFSQLCHVALYSCGLPAHVVYRDPNFASKEDTIFSANNLLNYFLAQIDMVIDAITKQRATASLEEQIRRFIQQNIEGDISREAIAANFYLHPDYLSHFFREKTGMTLAGYIRRVRIDMAKRLLKTSELPVGTIASRIGYESASHFTKAFRAETGLTPLAYRKEKDAPA